MATPNQSKLTDSESRIAVVRDGRDLTITIPVQRDTRPPDYMTASTYPMLLVAAMGIYTQLVYGDNEYLLVPILVVFLWQWVLIQVIRAWRRRGVETIRVSEMVINVERRILGFTFTKQYALPEVTGFWAGIGRGSIWYIGPEDTPGNRHKVPYYDNVVAVRFFDPATGKVSQFANGVAPDEADYIASTIAAHAAIPWHSELASHDRPAVSVTEEPAV